MLIWLGQQPIWFQVGLVLILFISFFYLISVLVIPIIKNGFSFKKSDGSTFLFGGTKKGYTCTQGKDNCPFRKDLIIFLNEASKIAQEKFTIIYITQIRDQLNYADQKLDQIRLKLHGVYLSELRERGAIELVQNPSFITYKYILKDIKKEMVTKIRYFFRENHFSDISEYDFNIYINEKYDYLASELTDMLNDAYQIKIDIPREELFKLNMKYLLDIKPYIVDIFQNAREVSIDYKLKLMGLDEKLNNLVKRFVP